jgi:hypothetical protein
MSDLVFIAFPTEQQAEELRNKILTPAQDCRSMCCSLR